MSTSWYKSWFAYGFGAAAGKAIFGEDPKPNKAPWPIRNQTEDEIRADEKRFEEDARRLDANDKAVVKK